MSVWDLDTGEKTMQFSRCHGDMELTAMTFDPSGRRLITGGRDGSLKIWNFNNGACLSAAREQLHTRGQCRPLPFPIPHSQSPILYTCLYELDNLSFLQSSILSISHSVILSISDSVILPFQVTSLCFLKQRIIVGGWNQLLSAYRYIHVHVPQF